MLPALLLFVVPNTLLANPQFQAEPRTYTARGTVVNSATGEAISGALVQLYGARQHAVLTGPDGKFQFDGLQNSSFQLSAQKPGYFSPEQIRRSAAPPMLVRTEEERPITLKLIPEESSTVGSLATMGNRWNLCRCKSSGSALKRQADSRKQPQRTHG